MKKIYFWLLKKYDWFIYKRVFHSIRRMCENNHGMAYLFELTLKDWRKQHPISADLKKATEVFYKELNRENKII